VQVFWPLLRWETGEGERCGMGHRYEEEGGLRCWLRGKGEAILPVWAGRNPLWSERVHWVYEGSVGVIL